MIRTHTIEVTPFFQNARILSVEGSKEAVVVDPGGDVPKILQALAHLNLQCVEIWLTHSHLDHCGGVAPLKRATKAHLRGHEAEALMRSNVSQIAHMYGIDNTGMEDCPEPDSYLQGGDTVRLGAEEFSVLFTPGHSQGHVCFYHRGSDTLFAGDTLFQGSIGRTDLPGGDHRTLLESIEREILSLPDRTKVLSGHGPDTTVGRERSSNPFLKGEEYA